MVGGAVGTARGFGIVRVLRMGVSTVSLQQAVDTIMELVRHARRGYVCVANVHMCMETFDSAEFRGVVDRSALTVADGKPIVWAQRILGRGRAHRVRGQNLTEELCRRAARDRVSVGFFGGSPESIGQLCGKLTGRLPGLEISYAVSPPYGPLSYDAGMGFVNDINAAGVGILFVGLGCPKQENWMAQYQDQLACVSIGVGAVFDFIAGTRKTAPRWMQDCGLEWLFRLGSEPARLWKRYLKHNPRFVYHLVLQAFGRTYP